MDISLCACSDWMKRVYPDTFFCFFADAFCSTPCSPPFFSTTVSPDRPTSRSTKLSFLPDASWPSPCRSPFSSGTFIFRRSLCNGMVSAACASFAASASAASASAASAFAASAFAASAFAASAFAASAFAASAASTASTASAGSAAVVDSLPSPALTLHLSC